LRSPDAKELLQKFCASAGEDAALYLDPMIQGWMVKHPHHRMHCTGFGIIRSVNQAADARMYHCACAHSARLNCNKQVTTAQAMVAKDGCRFPQSDEFGMCRGIGVANVAIKAATNDLTLANDYGADGDFIDIERALSGANGLLHPELVACSMAAV
jgi:hypothetical protein